MNRWSYLTRCEQVKQLAKPRRGNLRLILKGPIRPRLVGCREKAVTEPMCLCPNLTGSPQGSNENICERGFVARLTCVFFLPQPHPTQGHVLAGRSESISSAERH